MTVDYVEGVGRMQPPLARNDCNLRKFDLNTYQCSTVDVHHAGMHCVLSPPSSGKAGGGNVVLHFLLLCFSIVTKICVFLLFLRFFVCFSPSNFPDFCWEIFSTWKYFGPIFL